MSTLPKNWVQNKLLPSSLSGLASKRLGFFERRAFTLIEVLVVIPVIGVLVAILLPAVQAVREASRRITCQNHLRQLGLALRNNHSQSHVFPPGSLDEWSWNTRILPQLEQNNVYDLCDFGLEPFEDLGTRNAGEVVGAF
ncbi:MAG: DUF1559 domain-containing protein [Candidatus Paceibacterota bacterium]